MDRFRGFAREEGWRIDGVYYPPSGVSVNGQTANDIVTRQYGYVPWQSMFDTDGRHAYDRSATRYPRMRRDEQAMGRVAETPAERQLAYRELRPDRRFYGWQDCVSLGVHDSQVITRDQERVESPFGIRFDHYRQRTLPGYPHEPLWPSARRQNSQTTEIQDAAGTATLLEARYGSRRRSAERDPSPNMGSSRRPSPRRAVRSPGPYMREAHRRNPRRAVRSPSPYPREVDRRSSRSTGHGGASGGRR